MTTTAPTIHDESRRVFLEPRWLISKPVDLVFLFGGVFVSLAMYAGWRLGYFSAEMIVLVWIFVFHGPHFWGQISRTYLDKTELARRGPELWRSLLLFVVGPVFVGVGLGLEAWTGRPDFWLLFNFLAGMWAYHHVVKQHFGFMALYRAKHREFDRAEMLFHRRYLIASLWIPLLIWLCTAALPGVPFAQWSTEWFGVNAMLRFSEAVGTYGPWGFVLLQAVYLLHLVRRVQRGRGINLPETLIVLASVGLHWTVVYHFVVASRTPGLAKFAAELGVMTALLTTYHNLQYHALLWYYNRAKYHVEGARERYGLAAIANKNLFVYLVLGVVYTCVTIGFQYYDIEFLKPGATDSAASRNLALLIAAAIWGWSFLHYWVDAKIWHVREDADLRRVLGFPDPPPAPPSDS
ncbi:MAG: hypothetical protein H6832_15810 [Planctomycetes bacterium]|nr:hypothetical protein [Planctomycetota bacterium]MCB9891871.1 hypothetical protein [Planctomycetota bacterium]MCB9919868.1 hypothetical protein [Planctomycetota bacterium]